MKAQVIYDSVFGNTEKVARAIGQALGSPEEVAVLRVGDVQPQQVTGELIIVGSPTRAFQATPATTAFLKRIPKNALAGVKVAAFDTRFAVEESNSAVLRFMVSLFGYAAKPIADRLEKKGGKLAAPPEGFIVEGTEGPLKEGELERAAEWARQLLA